MPRLNVVDPATAVGGAKELFEGPLAAKKINIFRAMTNSPAATKAYLAMSGELGKSSLSAQEREIVALAIGQENDCDYCLAAHTAVGLKAGLTSEETVAARRGEGGDSKQAALATFVKTLYSKEGFVEDDDLAAIRAAGYDDGAIVEIIAVYAVNLFTNYLNHVNQTIVDFPAPPGLD